MTLADLPVVRDVPVATAAQMAEADRIAVELGIPLEVLMENAGHQIAVATRVFLGGSVGGRDIVAVCGTGNNGGDALAALRHLRGWGANVEAYVARPRQKLRPLAVLQYDVLVRLGVGIHDASVKDDDGSLIQRLRGADVILDGVLGYRSSGAPRGEVARLIFAMMASGRHIIAVDLPSGLHPDTGAPLSDDSRTQLRASLTVTLALPKTGLLRPSAGHWTGELILADIGIPPEAFTHLGVETRSVFTQGDLLRVAPR